MPYLYQFLPLNISAEYLPMIDQELLDRIARNDPALTSIKENGFIINDEDAQNLAQALHTNTSLTDMDLALNNIGAEGARSLARELETNTSLTSINLGGNQLCDQGAQSFAEMLEINQSLTDISLFCNFICAPGAQRLGDALTINNTLKSLDLRENNLGVEGTEFLAEGLKRNTGLTSINLYDNSILDKGASIVAKLLETNTPLSFIGLGANQIGADGIRELGKAFKINTRLTSMSLYGNKIDVEAAHYLAEGLKNNTGLISIQLGANQIEAAGAAHLAKALETNNSLTSIDLFNNSIRDAGMQSLANALKTNKVLTSLGLNHNQISSNGVRSLVEALKSNTTLGSVNLYQNEIDDAGAQSLAELLKTNTSLSSLELGQNRIGIAGAHSLAEALETNTSVIYLNLVGNGIRGPILQRINTALERNRKIKALFDEGQQALTATTKEIEEFLNGTMDYKDNLNGLADLISRNLKELETLYPESRQLHSLRAQWFEFRLQHFFDYDLAATVTEFMQLTLTQSSLPYYQTFLTDMIVAYKCRLGARLQDNNPPESSDFSDQGLIELCLLDPSLKPHTLAESLAHYFKLDQDDVWVYSLPEVLTALETLALEEGCEQDNLRLKVLGICHSANSQLNFKTAKEINEHLLQEIAFISDLKERKMGYYNELNKIVDNLSPELRKELAMLLLNSPDHLLKKERHFFRSQDYSNQTFTMHKIVASLLTNVNKTASNEVHIEEHTLSRHVTQCF